MMMKKLLIAVAINAAIFPLAHADNGSSNIDPSAWYVSGDIGYSSFSNACPNDVLTCDDEAFAGGIAIGYQFNKSWSLEGGYKYLGETEVSYDVSDEPEFTDGRLEGDLETVFLHLRYSYALNQDWQVYFKAGANVWFSEITSPTGPYSESDTGLSPAAGLGLSYNLTPTLSMYVDYQYMYDVGDVEFDDIDNHYVGLGLSWRFNGLTQKAAVTPTPVATPVQQPVAPAPVVAKETVQEVSATVSSSLFEFGSATLTSGDALASVVTHLNTYPQTHVIITGHTDNIGSESSNLTLSVERAQSVANYLMQHGVSSTRINVNGEGERAPIADNETASGRAMNRRVELVIPAWTSKNETH